MSIQEFIKPELLILVPVLYFIGTGLKKSIVSDKFIPLIIGVIGIVLAFIYVCSTTGVISLIAIFTGITQGILCAGLSVYTNQFLKQINKSE